MRRKNAPVEIPGGRWRQPQAEKVLRWWRDSGLSASAFARSHGLNAQRLLWWRKRLENTEETALAPLAFIPAVVTGAAASTVVRLPGGVSLELTEVMSVPANWIAALAAELTRQS